MTTLDRIAAVMTCTPEDDDDLVEAVRLLVAERDAARAARDALAGAVRSVGNLIADNGCDCDCGCAFSDGEHNSECDPCLACRVSNVVSPVRGTALDAALVAAGGGA